MKLGNILTINPGSAGPPRFQTTPSIAFLEIQEDGGMHSWAHQLS